MLGNCGKEDDVKDYASAAQLLRSGEIGLFIFTDGRDLEINEDGSGSTGTWPMDRRRRFDRVFIYHRVSESGAQLLAARPAALDGPDDNNEYVIKFYGARIVGKTSANWRKFAATHSYPIRYIERE